MNLPRKSTQTAKLIQYPGPIGRPHQSRQDFPLPGEWPEVPVFSDTRVVLELLLRAKSIDLQAVSEVLLTDLGATVQLLRLIGKQREDSKVHPFAIHECVVSMDKKEILNACSEVSVGVKRGSPSSYSELCRHSWLVSRLALSISEAVSGAEPEKARVAALLHDVGRIPSSLGWTNDRWPQSLEQLGCTLVDQWGLPWYVLYGIRCHGRQDASAAVISRIVAAAHDCERIYTDGIYSSEPDRYEPYWLAVLERAFPDMSVFDQQRVIQQFIALVSR